MRRLIAPAVLAGALLLATGCASDAERATQQAAAAAAYLEAGDMVRAREAARASVQTRDDIAQHWLLLGRIELMSGRAGDAYAAYSRALELDAANAEALQITAEIALQAGRNRDAARAADQLLALRPNLPRPKLIKGFVALQEGKLDEADRLANEILGSNPGDEVGLVLKARVLAKQGKIAEAAAMLEEQVQSAPSDVVLATLAEVQRKGQNGPGLARALNMLVEKAPTTDRVLDLVNVHYKLGATGPARAALFAWLDKRQGDEALYKQAAEIFLDRDPGVFDAARVAQVASTGTTAMRKLAARVLLGQGRAAEALRALGPVDGDNAEPDMLALAATAQAAGGAGGSIEPIVAQVLAADETNAIALLQRARGALARRDYGAAIRDAQIVVRDDPMSVEARLIVIGAYRARGEAATVRRAFEQAIQDIPKSVRMTRAYVAYLNETGDRARAMQVADAFTRLNGASMAGWQLLASQCRDVGCAERATQGQRLARVDFTPEYGTPLSNTGLFGRL